MGRAGGSICGSQWLYTGFWNISLNLLKLGMQIVLMVSYISWIRHCLTGYWSLVRSFETSICDYPVTQRRVPEENYTTNSQNSQTVVLPHSDSVFFVNCAFHNNNFTTAQEAVQVWKKLGWIVAVERVTDLFRNRDVPGSNLGLKVDYPA